MLRALKTIDELNATGLPFISGKAMAYLKKTSIAMSRYNRGVISKLDYEAIVHNMREILAEEGINVTYCIQNSQLSVSLGEDVYRGHIHTFLKLMDED